MATAEAEAEKANKPVRSLIPARMHDMPWGRFHWMVIFVLGTAWILDGLEIQLVASAGFQDTLHMSSTQVGLTGTIYLIGQVVGARGSEILVWAESNDRLHDAATPPERGDMLVFDRVNSDEAADLFGVVIARDERNVTEFLYLGGGVIRRGFVDASRPRTKRPASTSSSAPGARTLSGCFSAGGND